MWVWVNSGSWWWTGSPGVLRFMGSQRVGPDWRTELNWTELKPRQSELFCRTSLIRTCRKEPYSLSGCMLWRCKIEAALWPYILPHGGASLRAKVRMKKGKEIQTQEEKSWRSLSPGSSRTWKQIAATLSVVFQLEPVYFCFLKLVWRVLTSKSLQAESIISYWFVLHGI